MTDIDRLLIVLEAYCALASRSEARVATLIFNNGHKFKLLRRGADLGTRQKDRAMDWFADHWPEGAERPGELVDWQARLVVDGRVNPHPQSLPARGREAENVAPAPEAEAAHG